MLVGMHGAALIHYVFTSEGSSLREHPTTPSPKQRPRFLATASHYASHRARLGSHASSLTASH